MRVRGASPLLLLLAAPTLIDALEILARDRDSQSAVLRKREAEPDLLETKASTQFIAEPAPVPAAAEVPSKPRDSSTARYRVTDDAPVDGFDGKPHTGPFVDTTRDDDATAKDGAASKDSTNNVKPRPADLDKWTQAGTQEWRLEDIPEKNDGVMNDDNHVGPKKGTDGTAGGISEKEKERKLKGEAAESYNRPQEPKEAPPLPHSEEEYITKQGSDGKAGERSGTRVTDETRREDAKFGAGGYGIDLPEDLKDRQHKERNSIGEPPVGSTGTGKDKWLVDTMPYTEGQRPPPPKNLPKPGTPSGAINDHESWHEWFHSFVLSFTMILFSEIGDKTFLVAALMAMRHPRILVFSSAFAALVVMTVLSAVLGHAFPTILPKRLTTFAAAVLFLVFGARSLKEGLEMSPDMGVGEEMKEVEAELEEKEHSLARERRHSSAASLHTLESGRGRPEPSPPSSRSPSPSGRRRGRWAGFANLAGLVLSPAWVQTFVMTFLGEWGDRSQIATIAMAAGQDYWWVTLGAITGHACCTGVAVIGGRALAGRVSMRVGEYNPVNSLQV